MTLTSLLVHDVTILTPATATDRYGNATKDWTAATENETKGWVSQRSQIEDRDQREAQVSDWILYLHPDETITGKDRVRWSGITFEVDGPANPAGRAVAGAGVHHLEVPLRVVDG